MTTLTDAPSGTGTSVSTRTVFRTCPLCEAGCGLAITLEEDRGHPHPRRPRRRVQPRVHLPEGLDPQAAPRGPGPDPHAAGEAGRPVRGGHLGRGVRGGRAGAAAGVRRARARGGGRLPGQPERPHPGRPALRPPAHPGARHAERVLGQHRRPAPQGDRRRDDVRSRRSSSRCPTSTAPTTCSILGANPYASNGSLATAPDWPGRIEALRARGGRLVVVDPRRSRTAEEADEWVAVRPGTDGLLLAAMVRTLLDEDLVDLGDVAPYVDGLDRLGRGARARSPRRTWPT